MSPGLYHKVSQLIHITNYIDCCNDNVIMLIQILIENTSIQIACQVKPIYVTVHIVTSILCLPASYQTNSEVLLALK